MEGSLKNKAVKGIIWSSIERFSVQGIQFLVMIIMARLLTPKDYGLVGMLTIFIAIAQSLIDSGFSQALIRKQDRSETDNSTVFYFNIAVGFLLYLIFFTIAPWVADFYETPELCTLMRVISLSVIFNSLAVVQRALLTVNINFKTQAKASLSAAIVSGIIGISMAYYGFSYWSIAAQQLVNLGLNTLLLWIFTKWRPKAVYSWKSFKELFAFGSKLLASGLLDVVYRNMYLLVIGKVFSASSLGYYTRAHQFAEFPSSNLTGIMQRVTYPVLCQIQNDDQRLAHIYRRFLRVSAFIIFPLLVGLSAVAEPFVIMLLKEQWLFAATLLQIICFSMMWYPIHAINLNLLQVKGRSDLFLKLEIIKKTIAVIVLCITIPMGLIAMCIGQICTSLISLIINTYYTGKLINVGFIKQMRDLMPTLLLSLTMWAIVYYSISIIPGTLYQLLAGILIGIIYYSTLAFLFRFPEVDEIKSIIRRK
ncbi:lipopolysaccharide biosynthesis protein [uncultured Bacteroides sp.]|uniref:lipopolysaccharide biosynthesis protein n=1 Tax=uncultured Bacteroides sp. TaxID=162156 RepID=UPI00262718D2|nr:lipopolysaccharide biosynthesis protein [uncultured Bacteroides sp.]